MIFRENYFLNYRIECSNLESKNCDDSSDKKDDIFIINYVCYYPKRLNKAKNIIESNKKCLEKNLTLADYPTFHKHFIVQFFDFYKREFNPIEFPQSQNLIICKKNFKLFFFFT